MRTLLGRFRAAFLAGIAVLAACGGSEVAAPPDVLRVGTVGDSPPYSLQTRTGFVGIDIDLARDLGRHLGRPVQFVRTTWTTLIRDARQSQFDIAMCAVNITPDRLTYVDFSTPYAEQRYGVIVRCEDRNRFTTFAEIDSPEILLFVKQGAAQAVFALRNLTNARIRQIPDVSDAYERLASGAGDAVIGRPDHIRGRSDLCLALNGASIWSAPIAVLLPPESPLMPTINQWIGSRIADGTVRSLLRHYGLGTEQPTAETGTDQTSAQPSAE